MQVETVNMPPIQGGANIAGIMGLAALGGGIGYSIFLGSKIWSDFDKGKAQQENNAPVVLTAGIFVFAAVGVLISYPVWVNLLFGLAKLGVMNLIAVGALGGLIAVCISLNQRYEGGLHKIDEMTARCPNGQVLRRSASNQCRLDLSECTGDNKLTNVFKWWEIPALTIGGSVFALGWFGLVYLYIKKGKSLI